VTENIIYEIENDLREQNSYRAGTFSEEDIARAAALRRQLNTAILTNTGWESLAAEIERSKNERWFGYARVGWVSSIPLPPIEATLRELQDPISYDPVPVLERLTAPVLSINGGLDPNVEMGRNTPILVRALARAGNRDSTVIVLPGASHGLLESETGFNNEAYRMKNYAQGYLEIMADWLQRHVNVRK
jgi:pimeloyl-ACP methyl ester carboxylesterase